MPNLDYSHVARYIEIHDKRKGQKRRSCDKKFWRSVLKGYESPKRRWGRWPSLQALDVTIGQRVRLARLLAGKTQSALGKECGTTFEQIQKYENGANRVSVSRLYLIAKALNQPLIYFFQGIEEEARPLELTEQRDR